MESDKCRPRRRGLHLRLILCVCARHGARLLGCKSLDQVYVEPKVRRRARASPRGGVWRKPNPKARGDVLEPDLRCGTSGTSWHVTAKSSIHGWGVLYKSGVYARKVVSLTRGDLHAVRGIGLRGRRLPLTGMQKSAEGIVGSGEAQVWLSSCGTAGKPGGKQRSRRSA